MYLRRDNFVLSRVGLTQEAGHLTATVLISLLRKPYLLKRKMGRMINVDDR